MVSIHEMLYSNKKTETPPPKSGFHQQLFRAMGISPEVMAEIERTFAKMPDFVRNAEYSLTEIAGYSERLSSIERKLEQILSLISNRSEHD